MLHLMQSRFINDFNIVFNTEVRAPKVTKFFSGTEVVLMKNVGP